MGVLVSHRVGFPAHCVDAGYFGGVDVACFAASWGSDCPETSRFLRKVGEFAQLDKELIESVIREEEDRFYKYFVDTADFFTEIKNGLPYEVYTIADSTYALGVSKFLINELGYSPKRAFLIDNVPERYSLRAISGRAGRAANEPPCAQ